jgi:hypothetical protein
MPNLSARERSRAEDKGGLLYLGMEMFRTRPSARINNSGGATIAPAKVMTTEVSVGTSWRRLTIPRDGADDRARTGTGPLKRRRICHSISVGETWWVRGDSNSRSLVKSQVY